MNNKLYTLEELQEALSKYEDGDDSALEHLIDQVFKDYEPNTFHDIYTEEFATNKYESHQECYTQFKLILLFKFLESINTTEPQYQSFFESESERPFKKLYDQQDILSSMKRDELLQIDPNKFPKPGVNRLSFIVDHIIKYIIHRADKLIFTLLKICQNYPDLIDSKHFSHLLYFANSACVTSIKLNQNQIDLLKKYDTINPSKWIQVTFKASGEIRLNYDSHYKLYFRKLNDETILQMYLLGKSFVSFIGYENIFGSIIKNDTQDRYYIFIMWFWKFVHTEKAKRIEPSRLKTFCFKILQIVSKTSTGTSYNKQTFPLNDPKEAWYKFKTAMTNAKKKLKGSFNIVDRIYFRDLSE